MILAFKTKNVVGKRITYEGQSTQSNATVFLCVKHLFRRKRLKVPIALRVVVVVVFVVVTVAVAVKAGN